MYSIFVCFEVMEFFILIFYFLQILNPLSANLAKCSNTLKQFVGNSRKGLIALLGFLYLFSLHCMKCGTVFRLNNFSPMISFSGGIEIEHWAKIG